MQTLSYTYLINKPTRFPANFPQANPSLLDQIWTNSLVRCSSGIILSDVSDHYPIFIHLKFDYSGNTDLHKISFRPQSEENISGFLLDISKLSWNDIITDDVNFSMNQFDKIINELYCKNFPIKTKFISSKRLSKPWLSTGILKSIKTKSKYLKLFKLGVVTKFFYNSYKNKLTSVIRFAKNAFYRNIFSNNKKNSKKIWSTFRDLFGGVKERKNIRELLVNDETLTEDEDI